MAQASAAAALLRRLRRHRAGPAAAAAILPRRLVSSDPSPAPSSLGAPPGPSHLSGDGGGGGGRGRSAWPASHPRPRFPRRQHAAAMATRAAQNAASRWRCPRNCSSLASSILPKCWLCWRLFNEAAILSCSPESPVTAASGDASTSTATAASQSEIVDFIKSAFGKLEGNYTTAFVFCAHR